MYLLPKAKCFVEGKWKCEREHEHYRSIVAAPRDSLTRRQSRCARALVVLEILRHGLFPGAQPGHPHGGAGGST